MTRRREALAWLGAAATLGAPAVRAENGIGPSEIVLGQTAVLSGPLGVPIQALNAGAALAFKSAGPIGGRRVRVESLDDELKPDKALANYRALLDERKVFAFFGCVGSGTTAAAADLLQDSGAPLVGAYAVADSARRKVGPNAYFVRAGTGREAQALVLHLKTLGIERIGFAHLDNPGGQEAAALLEQALGEIQLKLLGRQAVKADGSNAPEAGAAMAKLGPQAVLMYLAGELPARLMKAHWAAGGTSAFYGMSIVNGEAVARALGADFRGGLVISQVVPYPWSATEPAAVQFRKLAEAEKVPVSYVSYEGYVNALVMVEALRRCGNDLTRAKLHQALRGMRQRIAGIDVDFGDRSAIAGSRLVDMVFVGKDGRFTR